MKLLHGDCLDHLKHLPDQSVDLIITSPPYNIGKEYEVVTSLQKYIDWQKEVIFESVRVLKNGGSICWQVGNYINKGAVYPIDCLLFPIFIDLGLIPRNRIIWSFGHGLHCKKRFSGRHESILWFSKGENYTFNLDAVRVPQKYPSKKHFKGDKKGELSGNPLGKNPEDVWNIPNVKHNHPEKTSHPCQFPEQLAERLIKSLSNESDVVLDMFAGSGTTGVACVKNNRKFIGIELDANYLSIAQDRINRTLYVNELANDPHQFNSMHVEAEIMHHNEAIEVF